jgi:hypothetical protein
MLAHGHEALSVAMSDTEKKCECGHLESEHASDQHLKKMGTDVVETFRGECTRCHSCAAFRPEA